MGIKDVFQEFKETKAKFDERYNKNKIRIQELNAELNELKAKYNDRIYQDEIGGNVFTAKEIAEFKKRMREIADEIEELETRNNFNRRGRTQALVELIPLMKSRAEARRAELLNKHETKAIEVRHKLAEYLLGLKELHDVENRIKDVNAEFFELVKEAGTNERLPDIKKVDLYAYNPVFSTKNGGSFGGEPRSGIYGVLPSEVEAAYLEGKLPSWVIEYCK